MENKDKMKEMMEMTDKVAALSPFKALLIGMQFFATFFTGITVAKNGANVNNFLNVVLIIIMYITLVKLIQNYGRHIYCQGRIDMLEEILENAKDSDGVVIKREH